VYELQGVSHRGIETAVSRENTKRRNEKGMVIRMDANVPVSGLNIKLGHHGPRPIARDQLDHFIKGNVLDPRGENRSMINCHFTGCPFF